MVLAKSTQCLYNLCRKKFKGTKTPKFVVYTAPKASKKL